MNKELTGQLKNSSQVSGDQVISASATGVIKVHILSEPKELSCVFESENLKYSSGHIVNLRPVRCLEASPCGILYGDDARNVKIVDWKKSLYIFLVILFLPIICV